MSKLNKTTGKVVGATRILTVTILLSLGLESTTRTYEVKIDGNEPIDETKEALKFVDLARRKYTAIMRMGGNSSILSTHTTIAPSIAMN